MSASDSHSSVRPSDDALLGLERLVVGRECNGFDRLSPARKARAFADLIRLGYAYGKVEEVSGRDYPEVAVQRVSSRGRRLRRSLRSSRGTTTSSGLQVFWVFLAIAAALLGCLFLMLKVSGN